MVRCKAINHNGKRCKREATIIGYCMNHYNSLFGDNKIRKRKYKVDHVYWG